MCNRSVNVSPTDGFNIISVALSVKSWIANTDGMFNMCPEKTPSITNRWINSNDSIENVNEKKKLKKTKKTTKNGINVCKMWSTITFIVEFN